MTIGSVANTTTYSPATLKASAAASARADEGNQAAENNRTVEAGETRVSISEEAKRIHAADADKQNIEAGGTKAVTEKAESFAYGALGMDHPDDIQENTDEYYTAGQALSALGTVATVLIAIV